MLVKTHRDGRDHLGLDIGTANARRYFRKRTPTIDLRLDDLEIQCPLPPDFWEGRPEIHDPRLSEWLEFKVGGGRSGRDPMLLTMVPVRVRQICSHTPGQPRKPTPSAPKSPRPEK